jgi:uncharacterized phiE125 gp8 family phage protein
VSLIGITYRNNARPSYRRTVEPNAMITLIEAKLQAKVDSTSDDTLITSLIKAAGNIAENKTGRAFMQSTWLMTSSDWPETDYNGFFKMYPGPLVSVTSVKCYTSNTLTTMATTDYQVDTNSIPGRIKILNSVSVDDRPDAVQITFKAGYGIDGDDVSTQQTSIPEDVKAWVKLNMTTLYEFRQLYSAGIQLANIDTLADSLIYPYII